MYQITFGGCCCYCYFLHLQQNLVRKSSLCKWSHAFPRLTHGAIVGFRMPGARDLGIFWLYVFIYIFFWGGGGKRTTAWRRGFNGLEGVASAGVV